MVELWSTDIAFEVSVLSRYLLQPCTGQLVQALYMFNYFDIKNDSNLTLNPTIFEFL